MLKSGGAGLVWLLSLALLALGCKEVVEAPSGLSYGANPAVYTLGTAITANHPTYSGGTADSFSVSPALPSGLSLDPKSGVISGTPAVVAVAAVYTITATNTAGNATTTLSITVNATTITITSQPVNQTIYMGQKATFSVAATGTGTLDFQWYKGNTLISGATLTSYTTPAALLTDTGTAYSVIISDAFGSSVISNAATLSVLGIAGPGLCTATGDMLVTRASHTATLLPSGKVLVLGGFNGSSSQPLAEFFDPSSGTFAATIGALTYARESHTATLLPDGRVLIAGGTSSGVATATTEIYDPSTQEFTPTGSMTAARSEHSATLLATGKVLIVGGRNLNVIQPTAELFDPVTGTFSPAASPVVARTAHTATLLASGKVLIAGGLLTTSLATAELYDPSTDTFTATGSMSIPRAAHSATPLISGKVLLAGGSNSIVAELYDPATGTFATTGSLGTARTQGHSAAVLSTGKVLIAGGAGPGTPAVILASCELYDPVVGTFSATGSLNASREYHTATTLPNGKILLAGGASSGYLASAELYF